MGSRYPLLTAILISAQVLTASSAGARPPDIESRLKSATRPQIPPRPTSTPFIPLQSAFNESTFFGGTYWAADSMRWEAIEDSIWTFDSGVGSVIKEPGQTYPGVDPFKPDGFHAYMEGWVGVDLTRQGDAPRFRRLSSSDPRWGANVCVGSAAGLGGDYSFWAGVLGAEADSLCYVSGQGYGNHWNVCIGKLLPYAGGGVTLDFDYVNETEADFDFSQVIVDTAGLGHPGDEVLVAQYTRVVSGHESLTLSPGLGMPTEPGDVYLKFCVQSDGVWSDEDGLNPTNCGAFAVDDVVLTGGIVHTADFEANDGGWQLSPPRPGPGGDWSRLIHLDDLPPPGVSGCDLQDSVLVFFDPATGGHPLFQRNLAMSPWIDLKAAGVVGMPARALEYSAFVDLPMLNYVFGHVQAQWFPDTCEVSGVVGISPIVPYNLVLYFNDLASCPAPGRVDLTETIPPHAEQVRVGIGALNYCRFFTGCTGLSNSTPWYDNIQFVVHSTNTIQYLVNSASPGDTVFVSAGTYTGTGNHSIDFGGKNLVLYAPDGPENTVIDCQGLGRGFIFQSGEDTMSVVDGFTIRNGLAPLDESSNRGNGGGVLVTGRSSPTFKNCVIEHCKAMDGAGLHADGNSYPRLDFCEVRSDTAEGFGGGINAADVRLQNCSVANNWAASGGGGVFGHGGVTITSSLVTNNGTAGAGGGLFMSGGLATNCRITENHAYRGGGAATFIRTLQISFLISRLVDCEITENEADFAGGGVYTFGGWTEGCLIAGNVAQAGGGIFTDLGPGNIIPNPANVVDCTIVGNRASLGGGIVVTRSHSYPPYEMNLQGSTVSGNAAFRGGGVYAELGMEVLTSNTILWLNCADNAGSEIFLDDTTSVEFTCSAVDSAGIEGNGTTNYNGPQVFSYPYFCSPPICEAAPTTSGDYTLASSSPCLPSNSPCGEQIGARGEGCTPTGTPDNPVITRPVLAAFPNPFAGRLNLAFNVPESSEPLIQIFDVRGRLVRGFAIRGGEGEIAWNGRDDAGRAAPPGVYFIRLTAGEVRASARVVLIR